MSSWYRKITSQPDGDLVALAEALEYFTDKYQEGKRDIQFIGMTIWEAAARLPGLMEYYYGMLQECEAIFVWSEIKTNETVAKARRRFIEHYNRDLNINQVKDFAETEPEVVTWRLLQNEIALIRNLLAGLTQSLSIAQYQLSNLTKLRVAGIEDATI